jgi:hypothetical protein
MVHEVWELEGSDSKWSQVWAKLFPIGANGKMIRKPEMRAMASNIRGRATSRSAGGALTTRIQMRIPRSVPIMPAANDLALIMLRIGLSDEVEQVSNAPTLITW